MLFSEGHDYSIDRLLHWNTLKCWVVVNSCSSKRSMNKIDITWSCGLCSFQGFPRRVLLYRTRQQHCTRPANQFIFDPGGNGRHRPSQVHLFKNSQPFLQNNKLQVECYIQSLKHLPLKIFWKNLWACAPSAALQIATKTQMIIKLRILMVACNDINWMWSFYIVNKFYKYHWNQSLLSMNSFQANFVVISYVFMNRVSTKHLVTRLIKDGQSNKDDAWDVRWQDYPSSKCREFSAIQLHRDLTFTDFITVCLPCFFSTQSTFGAAGIRKSFESEKKHKENTNVRVQDQIFHQWICLFRA
jgi:hypothetical protein